MIDEDRTYENEVRFNNDRLGVKNIGKNNKSNIPLDLESTDTPKTQKEEVNGICTNDNNVCYCRG
tara:strand:- start:418 stop:612 length:195 start_codon:yes stop_codon:yes gene_type:complete